MRRVAVGGEQVQGDAGTVTVPATRPAEPDGSGLVEGDGTSRTALIMGAATAAVMLPALYALVTPPHRDVPFGINDSRFHMELAEQLDWWPPTPPSPHFLFHLLFRVLGLVLQRDLAAALVGAGALGATAALVVVWARSSLPGGWRAPLLGAGAVALWVTFYESPSVVLLTSSILGGEGELFYPLPGAVNRWGSPTHLVVLPFSVLFLLSALHVIRDSSENPERRPKLAMALLFASLIGTIAKPTLTTAFIPALYLYLAVSGRWRRAPLLAVTKWSVLPTLPLLLWQTWFIFTKGRPVELFDVGTGEGEVALALTNPIERAQAFGWDRGGLLHWTMLLLFVLCIVIGGRRYLTSPPVVLIGCAMAVSSIPMLFLRESNPLQPSADLTQPFHLAWVLLTFASVIFLMREVCAPPGVAPPERAKVVLVRTAVGTYAVLSAGAGVLVYLQALGLIY